MDFAYNSYNSLSFYTSAFRSTFVRMRALTCGQCTSSIHTYMHTYLHTNNAVYNTYLCKALFVLHKVHMHVYVCLTTLIKT